MYEVICISFPYTLASLAGKTARRMPGYYAFLCLNMYGSGAYEQCVWKRSFSVVLGICLCCFIHIFKSEVF